jgi:hypothetical protein
MPVTMFWETMSWHTQMNARGLKVHVINSASNFRTIYHGWVLSELGSFCYELPYPPIVHFLKRKSKDSLFEHQLFCYPVSSTTKETVPPVYDYVARVLQNVILLHNSAVVAISLQNVLLQSAKFCNVMCCRAENLNKQSHTRSYQDSFWNICINVKCQNGKFGCTKAAKGVHAN